MYKVKGLRHSIAVIRNLSINNIILYVYVCVFVCIRYVLKLY